MKRGIARMQATPTPPEKSVLLSFRQAERETGIGRKRLAKAWQLGQLPCVRVGERIGIPRKSLEQLINRESA